MADGSYLARVHPHAKKNKKQTHGYRVSNGHDVHPRKRKKAPSRSRNWGLAFVSSTNYRRVEGLGVTTSVRNPDAIPFQHSGRRRTCRPLPPPPSDAEVARDLAVA